MCLRASQLTPIKCDQNMYELILSKTWFWFDRYYIGIVVVSRVAVARVLHGRMLCVHVYESDSMVAVDIEK